MIVELSPQTPNFPKKHLTFYETSDTMCCSNRISGVYPLNQSRMT